MITTWWVYRGIKKGLYSALNIFLVFFLPLLFTVNYFDLLFGMVGKIAPQSSLSFREAVSFCGTYFISFAVCVYFCVWLCTEKLPTQRAIDGIGGALFGAGTGIISAGVLMMFWFSMPFAERSFPVDEGQLFFPAHKMALKGAAFIANKNLIRGERSFSGDRFMRDLQYGLPSIPTLGNGYSVLSIPNGLRIFADGSGASPATFLQKIKERLNNPDLDITPSMKKQPFAEWSFTPFFVTLATSDRALIAVIMDKVPPALANVSADKMFIHDGEVLYSKEQLGDQILFIKIYEVQRIGNTGSVIALFQPQDPQHWDVVKEYLPTQPCFKFDEKELENRLINAGANIEESESLIRQVRLGGKAFFVGSGKQPMIVEMTSPTEWKIESPAVPDVESQLKNRARGSIYF